MSTATKAARARALSFCGGRKPAGQKRRHFDDGGSADGSGVGPGSGMGDSFNPGIPAMASPPPPAPPPPPPPPQKKVADPTQLGLDPNLPLPKNWQDLPPLNIRQGGRVSRKRRR